jgi:uncharacterized protein
MTIRLPYWMFRWMHRQRLTRRHIRGGRLHSWMGERVLDSALWRPTPGSLARAWLVGFPITMVPFLPGQSVLATIAALCVRGNILLCVALQFLSNPFTAPVQLSLCYFVGEIVRGASPRFVWQHAWNAPGDLLTAHAAISLYLGAVIIGIIGGVVGYAILLKTWRGAAAGTRPPFADSRAPIPLESPVGPS